MKYLLLIMVFCVLNSCRVEISNYSDSDYRACEPPSYIREVILTRINAARRQPRQCGNQFFYPAPAVRWNQQLSQAAYRHAHDMARYDFIAHLGSDGSQVTIRVEDSGYAGTEVGETIGAGYPAPDDMITVWLTEPLDCLRIMNPGYQEIGAACAYRTQPQSRYQFYWTLVLGNTY